jgi:UDP-glucuronate 4-epimerase
MKVLLTGAAGFIGSHVTHKILDRGDEVLGIDNLNPYYEVSLKEARLNRLEGKKNFRFLKVDVQDGEKIQKAFSEFRPDRVIHLAAQAGVRYSLQNPYAYIDANVQGFIHILEGCRHFKVEHLVYASSSSVYGSNRKLPFAVGDSVDHPVSLYAATKRSNELMAHCYSHLYQIPTTGLRFFTVYGPWGRPDMALFMFTKNILKGEPIEVFNHGKHRRDFTYIDDIVEGVVRVLDKPAVSNPTWDPLRPHPGSSSAPYKLYNIGNHEPIWLLDFIAAIEKATGKKSIQKPVDMQPGDVLETYADMEPMAQDFDFRPHTSIEDGIGAFVKWYRDYYRA